MEFDNNVGSLVFRVVHDDDRWLVTPEGGEQLFGTSADLRDIFASVLINVPDDVISDAIVVPAHSDSQNT